MGGMLDGSQHERAPFAAGVHLPWSQVPDRIHRWVEGSTGSAIAEARDLAGGFSPGSCAILRLLDGRSVFVKAIGSIPNPHSPSMHRREARVAAALPRSAPAPELLDRYDDGDWVALMYEEVAGAMPRHPWVEEELGGVLEALASLHEALTPCPIADLERISVAFAWGLDGWRSLAAMAAPPEGLDEWVRRNLDRLAELETQGVAAADEGDTLVHGDVRSDNLLLTKGSVVFVDWPHASRGAPVFDLVGWAPSVALEGGPDPETLLSRYRLNASMEPEATTAVIAAVAGLFTYRGTLPELPGLPTLRSFQQAQGSIVRGWLRQRTRWA